MKKLKRPKGTPEEIRFDVKAPSTADPTVTDVVYRHRLLLIPFHKVLQSDGGYRLDHYSPARDMIGVIVNQLEQHGVIRFDDLVPLWREADDWLYEFWVDFFTLHQTQFEVYREEALEQGRILEPPRYTPEERAVKIVRKDARLAWKLSATCVGAIPR